MRRVLYLLAVVAFLLPAVLIGILLMWLNFMAAWKHEFQEFGMKLQAHEMLMLELADFATTFLPAIGILIVVMCWAVAAALWMMARGQRPAQTSG